MRECVQQKEAEARRDHHDNVNHSESRDTIVVDYSMSTLWRWTTREIYCTLNLRRIYIFGVANVPVSPAKLSVYCYQGETVKKGGNDVASLIMKDLRRQNSIRMGYP